MNCLTETPFSQPWMSSSAPSSYSAHSWGKRMYIFSFRFIKIHFLDKLFWFVGVMVSGSSLRGLFAADPHHLSFSTCSNGSQKSCPMFLTNWLSANTGMKLLQCVFIGWECITRLSSIGGGGGDMLARHNLQWPRFFSNVLEQSKKEEIKEGWLKMNICTVFELHYGFVPDQIGFYLHFYFYKGWLVSWGSRVEVVHFRKPSPVLQNKKTVF